MMLIVDIIDFINDVDTEIDIGQAKPDFLADSDMTNRIITMNITTIGYLLSTAHDNSRSHIYIY